MTIADMPFFAPEAEPELVALPKCNLHTHLEGSVRPDTVWDLAVEQSIDLGYRRDEMPACVQIDGTETSLVDYLAKIAFVYQVMKHPDAIRRTAFEAAEDAMRDGVVYFELRAGPVTHSRPGFPVDEVIDCLLQGLRDAEAAFGMTCRLIVSALRNHAPDTNVRLAETAVAFRDAGVVAFDLAGDEAGYPAQLHARAFEVADKGGLGITVHAGEAAGAENVRYAVEHLGATRIGHGVRCATSREVLDLVRKRRVLLEVCPTSNLHTQAVPAPAWHPVRQLYEQEIRISIGDDDPVTSRTRVSNELTLLRQRFAFSVSELRHIQQMGLEAAFLRDEEIRMRLMRALDEA